MFDFILFARILNIVSALMNPRELIASFAVYFVIKSIAVAV